MSIPAYNTINTIINSDKYSPCAIALRKEEREEKKWVRGLDNSGNIEGIFIFCL
jgi:hypothetical protein